MAIASRRLLVLTTPLLLGVVSVYFLQVKLSSKHKQLEPLAVAPAAPRPTKPLTDSAAHYMEALTLRRGMAQRRPGELDTSFLRRVLPASFPSAYNNLVVAHAWRPTPFGNQLFFSITNGGDNEYDLFLFILDPFQADTYAVQAFDMGNMGDLTTVAAIFFTDVDQDRRKELLSLNECSLREGFRTDNGEMIYGHAPHYETHVFRYVGLSRGGRPQYREDRTPRSYLDELPTAAAVRQAIIKHQQRAAKRKAVAKYAK